MLRKALGRVKALSLGKKIALVTATLLTATAAASPALPAQPKDAATPAQSRVLQEVTPKTETKTLTETVSIVYQKVTTNDEGLEKGKTLLKTSGANGVRTYTYEVTFSDGVQTSKKLIKDEVTTAPISEVTHVGTKAAKPLQSCPDGTYTNTYGDEVCRPSESPTVPSGATARCRDGTYSYSQSRSGTCSHHGGVGQWL